MNVPKEIDMLTLASIPGQILRVDIYDKVDFDAE